MQRLIKIKIIFIELFSELVLNKRGTYLEFFVISNTINVDKGSSSLTYKDKIEKLRLVNGSK